jgi:phage terminase large subunit GpA-like protein
MSQGGYSGDETEENWVTTDRREWSFCCPECKEAQQWDFSQIRVPEAAKIYEGEYDYEIIRTKTEYECKHCHKRYPDTRSSRDLFNSTGHYVRMNPGAATHNVGFRWNAVAARPWGAVAEMYIRAKLAMELNADSSPMRIFRQKQLAEFWSDAPEAFQSELSVGEYQTLEPWSEESLIDPGTRKLHNDQTKDAHPRCRFMTVDVQRNGFYCLIRMWSEYSGSRLLTWKFVATWEDIAQLAAEHKVIPALVYVDCGDQMDDVIRQCGINKWTALRGDARSEFSWRVTTNSGPKTVAKTYAPARLVNVGTGPVRVHHFSNLALKDQLSRLRKSGKHTVPANVGQDYIDQMESEVRIMTTTGKPEWRRIGKRHNHLWDCEVMQLVPAAAFGLMGIKKPDEPVAKPVEEAGNANTPLEGVGEEPKSEPSA